MAGLLDFIQGASNSAASTLSGPVDLINMGLLGLGLPMPRNPVGGSQWMRDKGLTREPQNRTAGLLGEAAGNILPIVAAAKGPQIAAGLLQMGDNLRAPSPMNAATRNQMGAIVYHGSPHRFDKFDASHIGKGEGAQAYGHGLYFAENPKVAASYRATNQAPGALSDDYNKVVDEMQSLAAKFTSPGKYPTVMDVAAGKVSGATQADMMRAKQLIDMESKLSTAPVGHLYTVDLPDDAIARMLNWDAPLSKQPEAVRKAVDALKRGPLDADTARILSDTGGNMNAGTLYNYLGMDDRIGSRAAAAAALRQQGVPGIRYLDGGSRGVEAAAGTSNFVVFPGNEGLLKILGRE